MKAFLRVKLSILNASHHYREYGLLSLIKTFFNHLGFVFSDKSLIFLVCDLESISKRKTQDYSFTLFSAEDIQSGLYDYNDGFFSPMKAIYRIQAGYSLYVVKLENNKLASYAWIEQNGATIWWLDDLPVSMPRDIVLFSAEYTPPEFRNRAIAPKMLMELLQFLKENGIKRALAVVHPKNDLSLRMQRWLGFRDYQMIRYRRYWALRYYEITKSDYSNSKKVFTLFKSPKDVWRTYLP